MKTKLLTLAMLLGIAIGCQQQSTTPPSSDTQGLIKVTIMYPNDEGATFDMDYYREKHMPMLAELFGKAMIKYEIDQGIRGRTPEDNLPFLAIGYLYFNSVPEYEKAFGLNAETILSDIPNYTNVRPVVQMSEVIK